MKNPKNTKDEMSPAAASKILDRTLESKTNTPKPSVSTETKPDSIQKKYTLEETRVIMERSISTPFDPSAIFKKIQKEIISDLLNGTPEQVKKATAKLQEEADKVSMALGLKNHYALADSCNAYYKPLAIQFARDLVTEYKCETSSEIALAELVAGAYIRVLQYSQTLSGLSRIDFLSNEKNGYYAILSKEVDRANRHFVTALALLKQMKSPTIEVNIKAKTAFIAQNQQINNTQNQSPNTNDQQ